MHFSYLTKNDQLTYHYLSHFTHCERDLKLITDDVYGFRRSIRVVVRADVEFTREVEVGIQHITGHFSTHAQLVSAGHDFDYDQLLNELNLAVHNFNARGSGFVFNVVTRFVIVITQFRPLSGSSYIPTPRQSLKNKQ